MDPFPQPKAAPRPERQLIDPYAGYRAPIPQVDELLIVNPYSKLLSKTPSRTTRYFEPTPGQVRTATLEISAPPGFRGWVYLNGMALPGLPARTTVLAGDHGVTVAPVSGAPFTVWVQVAAGERQHFRFSMTGVGVPNGAVMPPTTATY